MWLVLVKLRKALALFDLIICTVSVCHRELEKQVAVIEQHRMEHIEYQQKMNEKCEKVKEAKRQVVRELEGHKAQLVAAENRKDRLLKELQMIKEKEAIFMDQRSESHTVSHTLTPNGFGFKSVGTQTF